MFNIPLIPARYPMVSIDGRCQSVVQEPGHVFLFDLTSRNVVSLETAYESVRIHMPQVAISGIAHENELARVSGLRSKEFCQQDRVLHNLALAVLPTILQSGRGNAAFLDYISLALHEHVVHTYGGIPRRSRPAGGLAGWQVRRVHDFVDANLSADPSITALSRECGISASHFTRAFRVSLGMTPHQWITAKRLQLAKRLMTQTVDSLANIALACGFVDQSHFGRHFARQEGISPALWRRLQAPRSAQAAIELAPKGRDGREIQLA